MKDYLTKGLKKTESIRSSTLSIYDKVVVGDKKYWLTGQELEAILNYKLTGINLSGLPLRTRSKRVKSDICEALGYEVPSSFKKTQPRFLGQNFDVYVQKSNNLQVWNEDLDPVRRYLIIRLSDDDFIRCVKVVVGSELAPLDTTGTLTQKYQARLTNLKGAFELVTRTDTENLRKLCGNELISSSPLEEPTLGNLFPIQVVYDKLKPLIGSELVDPGADQERNRGAALHRVVCFALGYTQYEDNGRFPDIRNQLLEVKLQTSPTVDLGLVSPDSFAPLDIEIIDGISVRHCDVRYAVFYGKIEDGHITITNLILTNGANFYSRFPKFAGKGLNKKIQIRLPKDFFD